MTSRINVGIVGLGLIGNKRAQAIRETRQGRLVAAADTNHTLASNFAEKYGCEVAEDWKAVIANPSIGAVVIAVPNVHLAPIALAAIRNGKHVLCEKPFGTSLTEAVKMHRAAVKADVVVKVGFNHRFHASLLKAHQILMKGAIGQPLFIRSRYGHGGRLGMEKEWRFDPAISGGGELLDQGVHIVDLAAWFGGRFTSAYGLTETKFWNTTVDDNAFGLLRNKNVTCEFHVSTTNWKNIFSFEVFGSDGYLQIEGKGSSYGPEKLIFGRRRRKFGIPIVREFNFPGGDLSWHKEWKNFIGAIQGKTQICGSSLDGAYANAVVEVLYRSSATHRELPIKVPL